MTPFPPQAEYIARRAEEAACGLVAEPYYCNYEFMHASGGGWLRATIAVALFNAALHFVWAHEIGCLAPEHRACSIGVMLASLSVSIAASRLAVPIPVSPDRLFWQIQLLYVPACFKVLEYQSRIFATWGKPV